MLTWFTIIENATVLKQNPNKSTKTEKLKLEKAILVYVFILKESNRELKLNYEFKKNFEN